jgi:hypothetical protein
LDLELDYSRRTLRRIEQPSTEQRSAKQAARSKGSQAGELRAADSGAREQAARSRGSRAGEQPAAQRRAGGSPNARGPSSRGAAACRPVVQRGAPAEALKDWTTGAFERNSALGYPQPLPLNFSPYIIFPPIFSPIFSTPAAVPPKYSPYTPLPL